MPEAAAPVLVAGPARAGVSSLLARLRDRMPRFRFVESHEIADSTTSFVPSALVLVVSATAPIGVVDCAAALTWAAHTDAVIGVVNKIDDHRAWRQVLAADRALLAAHAPRLAGVAWVGAAAAPRLGTAQLDAVVAALDRELSDPDLARRNDARARQSVAAAVRAEQAQWRHRLHRERLDLTSAARRAGTDLRAELQVEARTATSRTRSAVVARMRRRWAEVLDQIDDEIAGRIAALGDLPPASAPAVRPPDPPPRSRRLETQLMVVLGAGFGVGVALMVARLAGMPIAGLVPGVAVAAWVVRARAVLHDRAVLDRWVVDAVELLRIELLDRVSTRLLEVDAAHTALMHRAGLDTRPAGPRSTVTGR